MFKASFHAQPQCMQWIYKNILSEKIELGHILILGQVMPNPNYTTLSQIYPNGNWNSKLNTKLMLEFQVY